MATRWGIISAGKISHDFVTALATLPKDEHQVVAVAARKLEDAQAFAKKHGIPLAYDRYEDLAKNEDVQVVYIGCFNPLHFSLGSLMLENGKHVLVEKPLCLTVQDCKALTDLAQEKKLFLMEAIWSRFLPAYEHLMKELKAGTAGEVLSINCSLGFPLGQFENFWKRSSGGGSLVNLGIYCVNAIAMVYDHEKPERIEVAGHLNADGVDEILSVSLQYSRGRVASFTTAFNMTLPNELQISGTKGTFKIGSIMCCPTEVTFEGSKSEFPMLETSLQFNYPNSVGLRYEAMEVRRCLLEGQTESPRMSHSQSQNLHYILSEIRRKMNIIYP